MVDPESNRWEIHGQTTYLPQGYPGFRALYTGANSLTPAPQAQATWSNSLFLNVRLWEGGELYYNPELLQGFGLNDTVGVAGFPNGEAQKSNFPYPHYNTSRLFLRQTFGFGGEQEELASAPRQLASKVDVSRLTVQAGKFAVIDIFDGNAYAKDTRKDFMNWSMWAPGAFDYSADKVGLTYGATAEFNQKQWALRAGYFLIDGTSNSNNFDMRVFQRGEYVLELETRYSLFSQPGKLRTIAWLNSAYSGSYRETLNNPALNLDISQTRAGPHQIRLRLQPRAGADRRHRLVRPLELERRQDRDHGLHRHRCQPCNRPLDQGRPLGTARRRDRNRRRDQRAVKRSSRFHRGRRARRTDRRRRAQLPARAHPRDLLRLRAQQADHADRRLSVHHQPRLQCRPRPGVGFLGRFHGEF